MKKYKILFILCLLPLFAQADPVLIDGIYYNLKGTEAEVTNSEGGQGDLFFFNGSYSGVVSIPESINDDSGTNYKVTSISRAAFYDCYNLTSVIIPNSVTSIGESAFEGCSSLNSITIPNSVTSIGRAAFYGCALTSITVASGNTVYDSRDNCNAIIETSSNTLVVGCKNTVIPSSVTSIGYYAFGGSGLTSLTIPNSVTSIGESAFYGCVDLSSVTIGNGVTSIGDYAFFFCYSLTSITIPNGVTSIGEAAFFACNGLTSITVASGNKVYDSRDNCNAIIETSSNTLVVSCNKTVIPSSVISIGGYAFAGSGLTSITIPNSVTSIGDYAFGASGLTSITIPNSVTSIGEGAFYECIYLTSVTIGSGVTSIGYGAFYECSGLTSVTIPNSVTSIGDYAFYGCVDLSSVTIGSDVTSIGDGAFYECDNLTSVTALMPTPVEIDEDAFTNRTSATLYVPKGSKSAYQKADYWKEFNRIVEIDFDNQIFFADENVKALCVANWDTNQDGWLSYEEAAAVKDLGQVFMSNRDITSFDELQYFTGLTSIGVQAFYTCTGLTSVSIPNSVTVLNDYSFFGCSMTSVTIPNSVSTINTGAFWGCSKLTSVNIPNSVTSLGNYVFSNCSDLTSVTIGSGVTSIGEQAFIFCGSLTSVTIGSGVTSIGLGAFMLCSGLTSVTIPNSVTSIGVGAFNSCSGLTSVTIGNGVTEIGRLAFQSCTSLQDVYCYAESVPSTDSDAFKDDDIQSATLHVLASALEDYSNTEPWSGFGTKVPLNIVPTGLTELASVPVQVKSRGGVITVEGLDNNTLVTVYTASGALVGTATAVNHTAILPTRLMPGTVAIVKMGGKKVKMVVR